MLQANIDKLETELNYIKNGFIREQTIKVLESVNDNFAIVAASSTGKYHPDYALGEGGLLRHTKAAVKIAHDLLQLEYYNNTFGNDLCDFIMAALILHDSCKHGMQFESKYCIHDHPIVAQTLIQNCDVTTDFKQIVGNLVAVHMGQWTTCKYSKVALTKPSTPSEVFVHTCDYLASRKYLEVKDLL